MQTIVVDGLCWDIEFAGFAAPLRARLVTLAVDRHVLARGDA